LRLLHFSNSIFATKVRLICDSCNKAVKSGNVRGHWNRMWARLFH